MLGVFLSEGFKACWESSLVKDSRNVGVFLSEGFKACWESSLVKDSRHAGSLP